MKQLLQNMRSGEAIVVDVPVPPVRPGAVLVKTAASLVSSGTERMVVEFAEKSLVGKAQARPDLVRQVLDKARREGILSTIEATINRLDQPMALGYSSAGTVIEVGQGVEGIQPGDRVACAGGGYAVHAEYVVVPQNLVVPLPPKVDFESAAFATLGAISLQGFRLGNPQVGCSVAVIGLGLLGLLAASIANAAGCPVIGFDPDPARLKIARRMGLVSYSRKSAEEQVRSFTKNKGVDLVLICADTLSNDPVEVAGKIARDKGQVVAIGAVGLELPRKLYYEKELTFQVSRSYGPGRYDPSYEEGGIDYPYGYVRWTENRNIAAFIDLLDGSKIDVRPLITHRFSIENSPQAYDLITKKQKEPFLGVLLTYPQSSIEIPSPIVRIAPPAQTRPANVPVLGVLGAGNYATAVFLPVIDRVGGVDKHSIVSASGLTARHAAKKHGFAYALSNEDELLENKEINVVAILTRHNHHAGQVCRALDAGKHIYCEKPLAINREQLDAIEDALNQSGRTLLTVGFNRRFAPMSQTMKGFLDSSQEPLVVDYRINAGFIPTNHWLHDPQVGGGRIIGEACHFIDFVTFLMGSLPTSVSAIALPDDNRYRQDNVVIQIKYPGGSLGTIRYFANGDKSVPKERIEVFGGGRVAILDDFRSLDLVFQGRRQRQRSLLRQDKGHQAAWSVFLEAIRKGSNPPIPYPVIWSTTLTSFAVLESLRTGCPVDLPGVTETRLVGQ